MINSHKSKAGKVHKSLQLPESQMINSHKSKAGKVHKSLQFTCESNSEFLFTVKAKLAKHINLNNLPESQILNSRFNMVKAKLAEYRYLSNLPESQILNSRLRLK